MVKGKEEKENRKKIPCRKTNRNNSYENLIKGKRI